MSKLNQVREELQQFNNAVEGLKVQRIEKVQELQQQKKERQKVIMEQFGSKVDGRTTKPFNQAIEQLEKDIQGIDEQLQVADEVKQQKFGAEIQELKNERNKVVENSKKRITELENELFELKLKTMLELEKAGNEQQQLQQQVNEYHSIIRMFETDRSPALPTFTIYSPSYLEYGGMKAPVAIQNGELQRLALGGRDSRLPYAYEVYKLTGEVIQDEKQAQQRLRELQKGGN